MNATAKNSSEGYTLRAVILTYPGTIEYSFSQMTYPLENDFPANPKPLLAVGKMLVSNVAPP